MRKRTKRKISKKSGAKQDQLSKTEQVLNQQHDTEQKDAAKDMILYRQMAQDYWDRWQWEMRRRKEEILSVKARTKVDASTSLHQIDPSRLSDPVLGGI